MIDETFRYAVVNKTGEGKTTVLTALGLSYMGADPNNLVYANYRIFNGSSEPHPQWRPISSLRETKTLPKCLLLADELSKYVDARMFGRQQNIFYSEMAANLRKQGVSFAWSDTRKDNVDPRIRANADLWLKPEIETENGNPIIRVYSYDTQDDFEKGNFVPKGYTYNKKTEILTYLPLTEDIDPRPIWPHFDTTQIIPYFTEKRNIETEYKALIKWLKGLDYDLSKPLRKTIFHELLSLYNITVETSTGWPLTGEEKEALVAIARIKKVLE